MAFANQDDQVEVSDPVSLNALGIVDQASQKCKNVYITQGDYVTQIIYRYNTLGIIQLSVSTAFGTTLFATVRIGVALHVVYFSKRRSGPFVQTL